MSYRDINEKVFEKLNDIEKKKIEKRIDQNRPQQVLQAFPTDAILNEDQAVDHIRKATDLDESTIIESISKLIRDRKLITAYDRKNRLHLRKMKLN